MVLIKLPSSKIALLWTINDFSGYSIVFVVRSVRFKHSENICQSSATHEGFNTFALVVKWLSTDDKKFETR